MARSGRERPCWADTRVESGGRRGCLGVDRPGAQEGGRLRACAAGRQQEGPPWRSATPVGVAWPRASWQVWLSWQPAHPQTSDLEVQNKVCVAVKGAVSSFFFIICKPLSNCHGNNIS